MLKTLLITITGIGIGFGVGYYIAPPVAEKTEIKRYDVVTVNVMAEKEQCDKAGGIFILQTIDPSLHFMNESDIQNFSYRMSCTKSTKIFDYNF